MLTRVTESGSTTKLTKAETRILRKASFLLAALAMHQPLITQYKVAAVAIEEIVDMWKANGQK